MFTLLVILSVPACRWAGEEAEPCEAVDCLVDWALERWPLAPELVEARLAEETDPVTRLTVVMAVVEAYPRGSSSLCGLLEKGPVAERCLKISDRPHLWDARPERAGEVAFSGEVTHIFNDGGVDPYATVEPILLPCEGVPRTTCQAEAALSAARAAEPERIAALCAGVESPKWRGECFFYSAETLCSIKRPETCAESARLCQGAADFRVPCLVDVLTRIATLAPPATATSAADWEPLMSAVARARTALAQDDAELAERVTARTWAEAMMRAYASAPAVGNPLRFVPSQAHAHARAAIARRLMVQEPTQSLSAWGARIAEAEASWGEAPPSPLQRLGRSRGLWATMLPSERRLPALPHLGDALRVEHSDPGLDRLICALEAGARRPEPQVSLLEEGATHADRLVRWTAIRLLGVVAPEHELVRAALSEKEAVVRERARYVLSEAQDK